jgi:hypothetical protein
MVWDPGPRNKKGTGSQIPDPDSQHSGEPIKIQAVTISPMGTFYTFLFQRKPESFKATPFTATPRYSSFESWGFVTKKK